MADPALWRITEKFKALLEADRPDMQWFCDRSEDEPLSETELPGGVIRAVSVQINPGPEYHLNSNQDGWIATLQIDLHSGNQGLNIIDKTNQSAFASIVRVVHQNRTFDGFVAESDYTGMSGSDQHSYDVGITICEVQVTFFTTKGNFEQLLGPNGLPVP